jgi:hypothetical protein
LHVQAPLRYGIGLPPASAAGCLGEPPALVAHLAQCARTRGRAHALHALAEATHAALLPRFVSTLTALAALVLGIAWLAG